MHSDDFEVLGAVFSKVTWNKCWISVYNEISSGSIASSSDTLDRCLETLSLLCLRRHRNPQVCLPNLLSLTVKLKE
jgi:hypothetical protein